MFTVNTKYEILGSLSSAVFLILISSMLKSSSNWSSNVNFPGGMGYILANDSLGLLTIYVTPLNSIVADPGGFRVHPQLELWSPIIVNQFHL